MADGSSRPLEGGTEPGATAHTLSGDDTLELPEFDSPPADPVLLLEQWITAAQERGVREPLAVSLATADARGRPSVRTVLLKDITGGSLVFTSHLHSRKGQELGANPWAAVTFYWRETLQQIAVAGHVELLSPAESDALFEERPVAARATTAASRQSEPLTDEQALHRRAQDLMEAAEPIGRPVGWSGYRLVPHTIEFWQGRSSRLHRRLQYTVAGSGWTTRRLQP